jgi:hypothetical protein
MCTASETALRSFVFLTYPASHAGNAFGFNDMGITISENALFPRGIDLGTCAGACLE